jgi:ornithine cyclodeaminase/alanine dehydrogenase-like protein (mu-crystallin family)
VTNTAAKSRMIRFIDEATVAQHLRFEDLFVALRGALITYSTNPDMNPVRPVIRVPSGFFAVMPAVFKDVVGCKIINVFPQNTTLPTHSGTICLYSATTGEVKAFVDARLITEMRTACVTAIATDLLAAPNASVLAILGTGVQARSHVAALKLVRRFADVRIWGRSFANAQKCAAEAGGRAVATVEEAVLDADVVCTVTNSSEPILLGSWLKSHVHVNAVGAVGLTKRELDASVLEGAFVVVESRASAAAEAGDLRLANATAHAELGELLNGTAAIDRERRRTVYKSLGLGIEDLCAARIVLDAVDGKRHIDVQ